MAGLGESMASGKRMDAVEKQRQALELRKSGASYEEIAKCVGYSGTSGAHKAVQTALRKTLQEPADELRTLEVKRLDQMLLGLWSKATKGDTWAVDRVLKIMERRATLLGLDAPQRREVSGALELRSYAERVAVDLGLEPDEVLAQAERILAEAAT